MTLDSKNEEQLKASRVAQVNIVCFMRGGKGDIKILTLKRSEQKGGFWQTVTGGIHVGEDYLAAAKRETEEETGISDCEVFPTEFYYSFMGDDGYELTEYVFGCEIKNPSLVKLSSEHTAMEWLSPEDAKSRMKYDDNKTAIDAVCKKINEP